jgi:hypothetical protein
VPFYASRGIKMTLEMRCSHWETKFDEMIVGTVTSLWGSPFCRLGSSGCSEYSNMVLIMWDKRVVEIME